VTEKSFCSFIAWPMSPFTLSLPDMYAAVGFCSPLAIFMNVSDEAEIVHSASPPFSLTETLPSSTSTVQLPAPSISKR